ncbi:MAG TPA: hypothetical protein VM008_12435 [Phycisphaerae bacterium]|nr:hypothetical protein [Phycisphaerae bacterium]
MKLAEALLLRASPALKRLRRDYNTLLTKLKTLARFKTKRAAAEYAHREFTR